MNTEIVRSSNLGPSALGPARNVQNNKLGLKSRAQPEGPYPAPRPGSAGVTIKYHRCCYIWGVVGRFIPSRIHVYLRNNARAR